MALTQDNRLLSISSPLGKDELLLTGFKGMESISNLFEFKIDVLSKNHALSPDQLIGKRVNLTVHDDQMTTFNGYISQFIYGEVKADNLRVYQLTMVPWLWFLSKTSNHRIFQNKSTKEIVERLFQDAGFKDYDYKAAACTSEREYCVQYKESDFDFVSRLLEEDGIAYFFVHSKDKHVLHIVDSRNAYEACKETDLDYSKGNQPNTQVNRWQHLYKYHKGRWSLNDYDFVFPTKSQLKTTASTSKYFNIKNYEHYEYGPYYDFSGLGDLTKKRIEAEEAPMDTIEGSSDCSSFYAGGKFNLKKHAAKQEQGSYIITRIKHKASDDSYLAGNASASEYSNDFACISDNVHFRPPLTRQKPLIQGPQSATVVGPVGEEIYIDEYGRIKVQFHWDREGRNDETSSCFIRVMQPWAGAGWGTSFIPRIGMEVVVNFFDGDPDRPIVTGSVYNGDNKPPFTSKTQSGIKTRSSKSGTTSHFNELRFDDNKDAEQIYLHAEKNLDIQVENNETLVVDVDRTKTIGNNESTSIGKNRDKSVGENQTESIGKNKSIDVGSNHSESIAKDKTLNVGDDHTESIGKNMSINIGDNLTESIGKKIYIEAGDQIVLKSGSASITMKSNGDITIKGKNISLQGAGKINVKASSSVVIKGSKVSTN
ncbi:MAG: type VI secretion system tip protein VgrG [Gammaproteobacteria bacterium]|nr:type VI secretion system tip protein VgrG [Gammaproteobacteria bacterium]